MRHFIKLTSNYTIMSNKIIQHESISLDAKAIYFYMASLPDNWDFSVERIAYCLNITEARSRKYINELIDFGLLQRVFYHNAKGNRKSIYILYDLETMKNKMTEKEAIEFFHNLGNPTLGNRKVGYIYNKVIKNKSNKQNIEFEKKVSNETYFSHSHVQNEILHDCESENKAVSNLSPKPSENQTTSKKGRQGDMTLFESLPKGKGYTEEFETFWAMYRKHNAKHKAKAFEAYGKALKKGATHTQLLEALKNQTEIWDIEKRLSKYTPHCSTWLNNETFNDDFEAIKKQAISSQQLQQRPQNGYYAKEKKYSEDGYELDEKGHRINPDPTNNFFCPHGFYDNREEYVEFINLFPEGRDILDPEVDKADRIIEQNWLKEKARRREEKKRLSGN